MLTPKRSNAPLLMWLGYVVFVVYGSLVPLNYQPHPFEEAWAAFQRIPYLNLGVGSRADWISNGVLYVPVGFLSAYLLTHTFRRVPRVILFAMAAVFCGGLAVAVEFLQYYFPPRTVSLNDLLAEGIGSFVGLALAATRGNWFHALFQSLLGDSRRVRTLALEAYALGYIAFTLFPYDFLLSWQEFSDKINSNSWGWLIAADAPRFALVGIQLAVETALIVPFGFLLARLVDKKKLTFKLAFGLGLLLGVSIELLQLLIYTGTSQGLSVVTRAVGLSAGLALIQRAPSWPPERIAALLVRLTPVLLVAYAVTLLEINGYFTTQWRGLNEAMAQIDKTNFVPFYYHYYTTEARALFSLGVVALSYIPIAVMSWARGRSAGFSLGVALAVSAMIESGKFFLQSQHADPTNLLIACAASWGAVQLLQLFALTQYAETFTNDISAVSGSQFRALDQPFKPSLLWIVPCLIVIAAWVATYPGPIWLLLAVLLVCGFTVWRLPVFAFVIIPAAFPIFDLAPWSGRFFVDEFDALLAVLLIIVYIRAPSPKCPSVRKDVLLNFVVALCALSFLISTARGLMPFQWPDANSFNNYYSHYNALRVAKGFIWALLIAWLSKRFIAAGLTVHRPCAWGMTLGLTLTVAVIVWERATFVGLWDFASTYRVTGSFSAMHVGGAYIECFLVVATPFLIQLILEKRPYLVKFSGLLLLLVTTYALMVTFARNGYFAFAIGVLIVLFACLFRSKMYAPNIILAVGLAGAMLMVALPIYRGEFAQARLALVSSDMGVRQSHWNDVRHIRETDWPTVIFGMGVGRYPEASYWRSALHPRAGTFRLASEANNLYLTLGAGDAVYLEQFVALSPGQRYTLKLDVRSKQPKAQMTVSICEKWLLTSTDCVYVPIASHENYGKWRKTITDFSTNVAFSHQRPAKLSLSFAAPQSTIELDNLQLISEKGDDLIANGTFSAGLDRWFFAADGHLQWHTKSLFYGLLFDQGWLGILGVGSLISLAMVRGVKKVFVGSQWAGAVLAALMSFLTVGLFDTLIDNPRFLMLFLILGFICASKAGSSTPQR